MRGRIYLKKWHGGRANSVCRTLIDAADRIVAELPEGLGGSLRELGYTGQIKHNEYLISHSSVMAYLSTQQQQSPGLPKTTRSIDPFKECTNLKFVHQLIDFPLPILEVYRVSSIIPRVDFSSPTSLHNKFTPTNRQHPMRPLGPYWDN